MIQPAFATGVAIQLLRLSIDNISFRLYQAEFCDPEVVSRTSSGLVEAMKNPLLQRAELILCLKAPAPSARACLGPAGTAAVAPVGARLPVALIIMIMTRLDLGQF